MSLCDIEIDEQRLVDDSDNYTLEVDGIPVDVTNINKAHEVSPYDGLHKPPGLRNDVFLARRR